jgi:hypothetical protein
MGHHNQAFRQCADCHHWIGNNCQSAAAGPDRSGDGGTVVCRAFLRGSLAALFPRTCSASPSNAPSRMREAEDTAAIALRLRS